MEPSSEHAPEDIFFDSLQTLYDYQPIILTTPGSVFSYTHPSLLASGKLGQKTITLCTPDTAAANWSLHASSIWKSSVYLADHLSDLHLENYISSGLTVRILELGAGAGLPSITIATMYGGVQITVSDYPDEGLVKTLIDNIERNKVSGRCLVVPYAWGSDPHTILAGSDGFDLVIATDVVWNPESHSVLIDTLRLTLRKTTNARIHLVVGLHTGRHTVQSFLNAAQQSGFDIESIVEKESAGLATREWAVPRGDTEDERERRQWIVWIILKWKISEFNP